MRILVTGSFTGLGQAIIKALVVGGHSVTALVPGRARMRVLADLGAAPVAGSLADVSALCAAASGQEALTFCGDEEGASAAEIVRALIAAARTCNNLRSLVYTSALFRITPEGCCDVDEANAAARLGRRLADEALILNTATATLNTAVIRPGRVVQGQPSAAEARYFVQYLLATRPGGLVAYVGHRQQAATFGDVASVADFYRRLLEDRQSAVVGALDEVARYGPDVTRVLGELAGKGGATDAAALGWSFNQSLGMPDWRPPRPEWPALHN